MWLIRMAMSRPVTVMVFIVVIVLSALLSARTMKVDIFPNLNLPVVYVVQPYGGMDPAQFEAFVVAHYENHFLYISGVDHIESKSVQNVAVLKVVFKPDTNMAEALANIVAQVERSRSKMPPGTVTPFILRFDAGNVPVGYVVMASKTRPVAEIEALADERIRPIISTIPGANTTHPFGGNVRTIVVTVNSDKMRALRLTNDQIVNAISAGNLITPSGVAKAGDIQRIVNLNSTVLDIHQLEKIPLHLGAGPSVLLGDVASVNDDMDIPTGFALVNGRRTVFMTITKLAEASTVEVVGLVRAALPAMRAAVPEDIEISFDFDQSVYVTEAVAGLAYEGIIGALLTGLMVLLFLGDWRSSLIVIVTIPIALAVALVCLKACGQTINIMTLGGLSLAVGVLVDEATVAIENIHTHLEKGGPLFQGIAAACREVITPQLLAVMSVISVFLPSFFMEGTTKALFVPLSLAVGFAMVASYILSNTLVPILSGWMLKNVKFGRHVSRAEPTHKPTLINRIRRRYRGLLIVFLRKGAVVLSFAAVLVMAVLLSVSPLLKTEVFPVGNPGSFQMRLSAPAGTRVELTEKYVKEVLALVSQTAGSDNLEISICYVGTQPPNFGVSNVYIWTAGPQEAIILVSLKQGAGIRLSALRETLRRLIAEKLPSLKVSFESGDIINKIMNLGAPTPIQVDIAGADLQRDAVIADRLVAALKRLPMIRDPLIVQPLSFPTIDVVVDRVRAGILGVTTADVSRTLVPAVYSSRFLRQIWWRDPHHGHSYQIQVQYPAYEVDTLSDIENIPVREGEGGGPTISDLAQVNYGTMVGEYDRYNLRRIVSVTANIAGDDLGAAARAVSRSIESLGELPRGMTVNLRGQVPVLRSTFDSLSQGLVLAVVTIVLMLVAYFQKVRLALVVISVVPSILAGVELAIHLTGVTLNVQSFMGAIMAVGIGIANAILVVSFAEARRMSGQTSAQAAICGAVSRLRPVLMTSLAMIAGMTPMALGLAEGGERTSPLGIAVIGGLISSLVAVLFLLPVVFCLTQRRAGRTLASMLPEEWHEGIANDK